MAKRKRPVPGAQRRIVWRLYPDAHQHAQLCEQARMCADLWNALLQMIEARYSRAIARDGKHVSFHCAECARLSGSTAPVQVTIKLTNEYLVEQMVEPVARAVANAIETQEGKRASQPRLRLCPQHRLPSEFDLGNWISAPGHRAPPRSPCTACCPSSRYW